MTKMIAEMIKQGMLISPREAQRLSQLEEDYAHFSPGDALHPHDPEHRSFLAERMVYRGRGLLDDSRPGRIDLRAGYQVGPDGAGHNGGVALSN
jgi:hypothetical protein